MPLNTEPVVTSAFSDTPVDIHGRVREIVATRAESDTRLDQRLTEAVSRIEGVDHAGLAELEAQGLIAEQNVVYHLSNGGAFAVSVDAHGYRGARAMKLDDALELPSLVYREIEQKHGIAGRDGDETVVCQNQPRVIVDDEMEYADGHQGATLYRKVCRCRLLSPEMASKCDSLEPSLTAGLRLRVKSCTGKPEGARANFSVL